MKRKILTTISILLILAVAAVMTAACGSGGSKSEGSVVKEMKSVAGEVARKVKDEKRNADYRAKKNGGAGSSDEASGAASSSGSGSNSSGAASGKASQEELAKMEEEMPLRKDFRDCVI
jgi:hypothetical protein